MVHVPIHGITLVQKDVDMRLSQVAARAEAIRRPWGEGQMNQLSISERGPAGQRVDLLAQARVREHASEADETATHLARGVLRVDGARLCFLDVNTHEVECFERRRHCEDTAIDGCP